MADGQDEFYIARPERGAEFQGETSFSNQEYNDAKAFMGKESAKSQTSVTDGTHIEIAGFNDVRDFTSSSGRKFSEQSGERAYGRITAANPRDGKEPVTRTADSSMDKSGEKEGALDRLAEKNPELAMALGKAAEDVVSGLKEGMAPGTPKKDAEEKAAAAVERLGTLIRRASKALDLKSPSEATRLLKDLINDKLDAAGMTDYRATTSSVASRSAHLVAVAKTSENVGDRSVKLEIPKSTKDDSALKFYQKTVSGFKVVHEWTKPAG